MLLLFIDINEAHSIHEEIVSLAEDVSNKQSAACSQSIEGTLPGSRRVLIEEVEGISETEGKQMQSINYNDVKETSQEIIHQRENKDQGDQKAMADYWHAKGNKFFKGKKFEKAYDCYTKSLSYASENVLVLSNRALCQLRLKNYIGAEKDASSAITLDSNFVKAFHHRALARHALLKREEGIEDLNVCSNTALLANKFCCIDLSTKNKELAA